MCLQFHQEHSLLPHPVYNPTSPMTNRLGSPFMPCNIPTIQCRICSQQIINTMDQNHVSKPHCSNFQESMHCFQAASKRLCIASPRYEHPNIDTLHWWICHQWHSCWAQLVCNACRERKFVLSYFLADDTLSIFEPPQRNTGITGGKYLERSKV